VFPADFRRSSAQIFADFFFSEIFVAFVADSLRLPRRGGFVAVKNMAPPAIPYLVIVLERFMCRMVLPHRAQRIRNEFATNPPLRGKRNAFQITESPNLQISKYPNSQIPLIAFHNPRSINVNPANSAFSKQGA
jgi:hypothetical protein